MLIHAPSRRLPVLPGAPGWIATLVLFGLLAAIPLLPTQAHAAKVARTVLFEKFGYAE